MHWNDDIKFYEFNVLEYVGLNFGKLLNEIIGYIIEEIHTMNVEYHE